MDSNSAVVRLDDKPDKPFTLIGKEQTTQKKRSKTKAACSQTAMGVDPSPGASMSANGAPSLLSTHPGTREPVTTSAWYLPKNHPGSWWQTTAHSKSKVPYLLSHLNKTIDDPILRHCQKSVIRGANRLRDPSRLPVSEKSVKEDKPRYVVPVPSCRTTCYMSKSVPREDEAIAYGYTDECRADIRLCKLTPPPIGRVGIRPARVVGR
ncbi:hypothetical protein EVAR_64379_1 [Eumeta japonica]|uniref:Uncharacterized protein n=1 Tax=Eumeta variegata TaxID=151549 RepID=A0A4C1SEK5_EUMVA|nr:hypothetical protein EVAR_64379_1 [Eumeta japonica]